MRANSFSFRILILTVTDRVIVINKKTSCMKSHQCVTSCRRAAATICPRPDLQRKPAVAVLSQTRRAGPDQLIRAIQPAGRTRRPPTGCTRQTSDRRQTASSLNAPPLSGGIKIVQKLKLQTTPTGCRRHYNWLQHRSSSQNIDVLVLVAAIHDDVARSTQRQCSCHICEHRRRSRGGDRGIGPPLSGLGDNPPTFCCNIGKKYQNLLRIA